MGNTPVNALDFLSGSDRCVEALRRVDWVQAGLGAPETWPGALQVFVRMLPATPHPMLVLWGANLVCLCNDAAAALIGVDPAAVIGRPASTALGPTWPAFSPHAEQALRGGVGSWVGHLKADAAVGDASSEVSWTFSCSPIPDAQGTGPVAGVLLLAAQASTSREKQPAPQGVADFPQVFDQAPVIMAVVAGPTHRIELANRACRELTGRPDLVGRTLEEVLPKAQQLGYIDNLDEIYRSGQAYVAESTLFRQPEPDGTRRSRLLDFVCQPLADRDGVAGRILIMGVEVTERVRAQDALKLSEEQLRLATENGEIGLWDVDVVHETLFWPARVKAMFGISADRDVSMKDFYAGLHPLDRYEVTEAFAAAVDPRQRAIYDAEYRTIGKEDGVVRWVAARGRGQFSREGRCTRVIGTAIDITVRKRDEARLLELNEALGQRLSEYLAERKLLADIVDGTDAIVQVADLNFRWLAINRASADEFERIFGKRPGVGLSMIDLLEDQPEHQAAVRAVWGRALAGEEFVEVGVFGMPERRRRHYEMRFRNLYDQDGRRIGAYQFVYDVTARIESEEKLAQAEEALHQAQKMEAVGRLTGGIAHDFNNLLQVFRTLFETVRLKPDNADTVKSCGERGIAATEKAARLTAQLLTFSRQQPLDVKPLHLRSVFEALETLLRTTIGTTVSVEIRPYAVPQDLQVLADATQLEMALLNVAINARDAMAEGGTLTFSVEESPDGVVTIRATDTGQGMPPEVLRKAFDPFFTTKDVGKGSGLGLSQVYGMAQRANGSVALESTVGVGTTVLIRLRRAVREAGAEEADRTASEEAGVVQRSTSVLLVDDDPDVRTSVADMLVLLGHRCTQAGGGPQALTLLEQDQFELMLVDFAMPGMDGATVARRARSMAPGMRIVMMSGYADLEAIETALGPGEMLLRKPFQLADLQSALQRIHRR